MPASSLLRGPYASLIFTLLLGVVSLLVSSTVTFYAIRYETTIQGFNALAWAGFYIVTGFTMAYALTPTTFIALLSGYFLGWYAVVPVVLSYLAASWIGYHTAQWLDKGRMLDYLTQKEKVRKVVENLKDNEFNIIVLSRLSPILPFAITNVLFSLAGANLRPYLGASLIGMLPRTLLTLLVGSQARQIKVLLEEGGGSPSLKIGLAVLVMVSLAGLFYYIKRAVSGSNRGK
jgi:uncharacterized membrane protein YdjX (TVP38/TMEM64 family)